MKKVIAILTIGILIATLWLVNDTLDKAYADKCIAGAENVRAVECVVVSETQSILTLEDSEHNYWQIGDDRYSQGDVVIAWIDNNNTENDLTDDIIIDTCKGIAD